MNIKLIYKIFFRSFQVRFYLTLLILIFYGIYARNARAVFIELPGNDTACNYNKQFNWDWPPPVPPVDSLTTGINWRVTLNGNNNPAPNSRSLAVTVQHTPDARALPCHTGETAGPVLAFPLDPLIPIIATRPPGMGLEFQGQAQQRTHAGHVDVARVGVTTLGLGFPPGPEARVVVKADHYGVPPFGFRLVGSFTHPGIISNRFTTTATPSYRKRDGTIVLGPSIGPNDGNPAQPGERETYTFPRFLNRNPLSNYTITGTGSGSSSTTLAYLGLVDGVFSEMDIDLATLTFVGTEEFIVPFFFDPLIDLHIGVDLAQWFLNPPVFNFGDTVTFTNGTNPEYSGVIIGTSEIYFDGTLGFSTDNPFTGTLTITGGIDGQVVPVPEPTSTLNLLALGTLGVASTFKRKLKPSKKDETLVS